MNRIDWWLVPRTAAKVVTSPRSFFREIPRTGGFTAPLLFMSTMGLFGGIILAIFDQLDLDIAESLTMGATSLIIVPILVVISCLSGAALLFLIWKLMGSIEAFGTTFRCAAYLSLLTPIITLLGIVPYWGHAIGFLTLVPFLAIAAMEVHRIPALKAWAMSGLIGVMLIIVSLGADLVMRVTVLDEDTMLKRGAERTAKAIVKQNKEIEKKSEEAMKRALDEVKKEMERRKHSR